MSRSATYRGPFADGVYDFTLDIGGLEELDEQTDAGPEELYHQISDGRWKVKHLREPIRIGLIRAGMEPMKALALVSRYAVPPHLVALKPLAMSILGAALVGAPEEDKGAGEPEAGASDPSPAEKSGSRPSTRPAGKSASRPRKSAAAPSGS